METLTMSQLYRYMIATLAALLLISFGWIGCSSIRLKAKDKQIYALQVQHTKDAQNEASLSDSLRTLKNGETAHLAARFKDSTELASLGASNAGLALQLTGLKAEKAKILALWNEQIHATPPVVDIPIQTAANGLKTFDHADTCSGSIFKLHGILAGDTLKQVANEVFLNLNGQIVQRADGKYEGRAGAGGCAWLHISAFDVAIADAAVVLSPTPKGSFWLSTPMWCIYTLGAAAIVANATGHLK